RERIIAQIVNLLDGRPGIDTHATANALRQRLGTLSYADLMQGAKVQTAIKAALKGQQLKLEAVLNNNQIIGYKVVPVGALPPPRASHFVGFFPRAHITRLIVGPSA